MVFCHRPVSRTPWRSCSSRSTASARCARRSRCSAKRRQSASFGFGIYIIQFQSLSALLVGRLFLSLVSRHCLSVCLADREVAELRRIAYGAPDGTDNLDAYIAEVRASIASPGGRSASGAVAAGSPAAASAAPVLAGVASPAAGTGTWAYSVCRSVDSFLGASAFCRSLPMFYCPVACD
jgi:hypothetical protein